MTALIAWALAHWQAALGVLGAGALGLGGLWAYLRGRQSANEARTQALTEQFAKQEQAAIVAERRADAKIDAINSAHPGDAGAHDRLLELANLITESAAKGGGSGPPGGSTGGGGVY